MDPLLELITVIKEGSTVVILYKSPKTGQRYKAYLSAYPDIISGNLFASELKELQHLIQLEVIQTDNAKNE